MNSIDAGGDSVRRKALYARPRTSGPCEIVIVPLVAEAIVLFDVAQRRARADIL